VADREPTREEEVAAGTNAVDPDARKAYEDMLERGARQEGEGKPGV